MAENELILVYIRGKWNSESEVVCSVVRWLVEGEVGKGVEYYENIHLENNGIRLAIGRI